MARAATAGEITKLRSGGQWSELYLAVHNPSTVLACQVNQAFTSYDSILQVTYDTVTSGSYSNVIAGMTLWVGSTAGAYDLGQCRIRKAPTSTVLYIAETSDITWADNLYLTVVNEFAPWAKHPVLADENTTYMDVDVAYSDQHASATLAPVVVLGPDAVLWLTGSTVNFSPTAANSWVLGSTISSYSWTATGASATANMTTATPTITYNAVGTYRVSCTVTAANGKTATGYRLVFVYSSASLPVTSFTLESCVGDYESNGWTFSVTLRDEASLSAIRDRAKIILFTRDYYDDTLGSIGPITGYENILCEGWVSEESIHWSADRSAVQFSVVGIGGWLEKLAGFPLGLKYSSTAPTDWKYMQGLTVDRGILHFIHYRSTVSLSTDVYPTGDTKLLPAVDAPLGTLKQALEVTSKDTILARPLSDRFNRLIFETDSQYLAVADRTSIPTVMSLTSQDWRGEVSVTRRVVPEVSFMEVSGISYDGSTASPLFSHAPGTSLKTFGASMTVEKLLLSSQSQLNELAALLLGNKISLYPSVEIPLASNHRLIDICPRQYIDLTISASDTVRGISWTNQKIVPRRISYEFAEGEGLLSTIVQGEPETFPAQSVTYYKPTIPIPNIPPGDNRIRGGIPIIVPTVTFPPVVLPPDLPPDTGGTCDTAAASNGPWVLFYGGTLSQNDVAKSSWAAKLRSHDHVSVSTYQITGRFQKKVSGLWTDTSEDTFYDVKAYDSSGNLISIGTHYTPPAFVEGKSQTRTGWFDIEASTDVAYFTVELLASEFVPDSVVVETWADRGCTGATAGSQVWWSTPQGGVGVSVEGLAWAGYYYMPGFIITMYPPTGKTYAAGFFDLKSSNFQAHTVDDNLRMSTPVDWEVYWSSLSWYVISSAPFTPSPTNSVSVSATPVSFQNIISASRPELGLRLRWGDSRNDHCVTHIVDYFDIELELTPTYRILLDDVLLWNVCSIG